MWKKNVFMLSLIKKLIDCVSSYAASLSAHAVLEEGPRVIISLKAIISHSYDVRKRKKRRICNARGAGTRLKELTAKTSLQND